MAWLRAAPCSLADSRISLISGNRSATRSGVPSVEALSTKIVSTVKGSPRIESRASAISSRTLRPMTMTETSTPSRSERSVDKEGDWIGGNAAAVTLPARGPGKQGKRPIGPLALRVPLVPPSGLTFLGSALRLAVYTDDLYRRDGESIYSDLAFSLFLGGLAQFVDRLTVVGRLHPEPGRGPHELPAGADFVALPYISDLSQPRAAGCPPLWSAKSSPLITRARASC